MHESKQTMTKRLGKYFLLFQILGLLACSSPPPKTAQNSMDDPALGRTSVVSTGSLNLDPQKPSTISWSSAVEVVGSDDDAKTLFLENTTQSAVESQISHKGYPLVSMMGDYQMTALLVLGMNGQVNKTPTDPAHSELMQKTGIDPGLAGSTQAAGKGSLVIELRQGHALRWRGVAQIYILPEYNPDIARLRIEYAVAQLLLTWP